MSRQGTLQMGGHRMTGLAAQFLMAVFVIFPPSVWHKCTVFVKSTMPRVDKPLNSTFLL